MDIGRSQGCNNWRNKLIEFYFNYLFNFNYVIVYFNCNLVYLSL